ncbi:MAG: hypothetical protein ACOY4W_16735 [Thermodesulfobacteriota bacterium]
MDGRTLLSEMLGFLDRGESDTDLLGLQKLYRCLDEAACQFARVTGALTGEVVLTTVADQQAYNLPPEFIRPLVRTKGERFVARHDGADGTVSWIAKTDYSRVFLANRTEAAEIPACFCIRQRSDAAAAISGAATAIGAQASGLVLLQDSGADFSGVMVRDMVHNVTKNTHGLVISVTSPTVLSCAMFPASRASIASGNSYTVRPASREQLVFDAPCAVTGNTLTLPSVVLPGPLYHEYSFLGLPPESCRAIAAEAAFLFATNREDMKAKPTHHQLFLAELRQHKIDRAKSLLQGSPDPGLM